jgi:hypothetical protein
VFLDDVGDKIAAATALTLGTDLFLGLMPESPTACVAVIETPGLSPVRTMGGGIQIEIQGFQVIAREDTDNYDTVRTTMNGIYTLLAATTQETINSVVYHQFEALSGVFNIGADNEDHIQVAANFLAWKDPTP